MEKDVVFMNVLFFLNIIFMAKLLAEYLYSLKVKGYKVIVQDKKKLFRVILTCVIVVIYFLLYLWLIWRAGFCLATLVFYMAHVLTRICMFNLMPRKQNEKVSFLHKFGRVIMYVFIGV